jgi:hypothetical protein
MGPDIFERKNVFSDKRRKKRNVMRWTLMRLLDVDNSGMYWKVMTYMKSLSQPQDIQNSNTAPHAFSV